MLRSPYKDMRPMIASIDKITGLLSDLEADKSSTLIAISGGEPLLQKEAVLELIRSLKANNYVSMLFTNGSLIEDDFVSKVNEFGLNHINISFYALDDKWHRWYTGHSNKDTINALKLVTEKFEGFTTVTIILFNYMDMASLEDTCKFLYNLNQNFIVKIACPIHSAAEYENCVKERRLKAEEIALQYFDKIIRNDYYSERKILRRCQIVEDKSGHMKLSKSWEYESTKEAMTFGWKEAMKYG
jgi:MoaA/NifB/PqqE/SkfB family radical SAM enzyme